MLNYISQDPEERVRYLRRKIAMMDMKSALTEAHREGEIKGKIEGEINGEIKVLRRQLIKHFGDIPAWAEARLNSATATQLEIWSDRVLTADQFEEVFD